MRIAVIPGDGIGVEVTAEALKAVRAAGEVSGRRPDLVMRFGYGPTLPYSARRPVSAVLV